MWTQTEINKLRLRRDELVTASRPIHPTLEEEFKCSRRTINRYLKEVIVHGIPQLEYKGTQITTLEQLLADNSDNLDLFDITEYHRNKWDVHAKDEQGILQRATNWQIKVKFGLKKPRQVLRDLFDTLIEDLKKLPEPLQYKYSPGGVLLEIGLFDFHLGNLAWKEETGEDWNLEIAKTAFKDAINGLLMRAHHHYKIDKIIYPVGNDFFHADSKKETTTAGTQMSLDTRWQKMYRIGIELQRWAIERLRQIAPVDVIIIPGNHDEVSAFTLGEVLVAIYEKINTVNIINNASLRKYYCYGNTLLGFTHGCYEPIDKLPMIMAAEAKEDWGRTKFREFHIGHFHHRKAKRFMQDYHDDEGVLVRILPTLTAFDDWHTQKGLTLATRAAEAYFYDYDEGLIATLHAQRTKNGTSTDNS